MRCFDGHCDTLARCMTTGEGLRQNGGHVDLARCAALGQHAQIFAVFADSSKTSAPLYTVAQRQHALLERECARNADLVRRCRTARETALGFLPRSMRRRTKITRSVRGRTGGCKSM